MIYLARSIDGLVGLFLVSLSFWWSFHQFGWWGWFNVILFPITSCIAPFVLWLKDGMSWPILSAGIGFAFGGALEILHFSKLKKENQKSA